LNADTSFARRCPVAITVARADYAFRCRNQYDLADMSLLEEFLLREKDIAQSTDAGYHGLYLALFDIANKVAEHVRLKDRAPE